MGLALACRTELFLAHDLLNRGSRYDDAEAFQLAHNALIAPPRILPCQANDQRSTLFGDLRTTRSSRIGPAPRHRPAVPAQERGTKRDKLQGPLEGNLNDRQEHGFSPEKRPLLYSDRINAPHSKKGVR
jgi:hypothetical protein